MSVIIIPETICQDTDCEFNTDCHCHEISTLLLNEKIKCIDVESCDTGSKNNLAVY